MNNPRKLDVSVTSKGYRELPVSSVPDLSIQENDFYKFISQPAINKLATLKDEPYTIDALTGTALFEAGALNLSMESYEKLNGLKVGAVKLLDICCMAFSEAINYGGKRGVIVTPLLEISTERYMELTGQKDRKEAVRKLKHYVEVFNSIELSYNSGNGRIDFLKVKLLDSLAVYKRGEGVILRFSQTIAEKLAKGGFMFMPKWLLRCSDLNQNTYPLGRTLLTRYFSYTLRNEGKHDIISVQSALEACSDTPSIEKVKQGDRAYTRKLIVPLEKALNSLTGIRWEWCNAKKEPLRDDQIGLEDFNTLKDLYIKYEVIDAPDITPKLIEWRNKKAEAKKKKPRSKAKKKPTNAIEGQAELPIREI